MKTSNRNALLPFDFTANLLKSLYPEENWVWFLTKNIHGLTDGYPTIPYDQNVSEIAYWITDIDNFAISYGADKFSSEEVITKIDKFVFPTELGLTATDMGNISNAFTINSNFMSLKTENDDGSVDLRLDSPEAWIIEINEMSDIQIETCYALTTLAHAIRMVGEGMLLSKSEAEALSGIAIAQAYRAYDNADQIRSILN